MKTRRQRKLLLKLKRPKLLSGTTPQTAKASQLLKRRREKQPKLHAKPKKRNDSKQKTMRPPRLPSLLPLQVKAKPVQVRKAHPQDLQLDQALMMRSPASRLRTLTMHWTL